MAIEQNVLGHAGKVLHAEYFFKYQKNEGEEGYAEKDEYDGKIDTAGLEFVSIQWIGAFDESEPITSAGFRVIGTNTNDGAVFFTAAAISPFKVEGDASYVGDGVVSTTTVAGSRFIAFYRDLPRYITITPNYGGLDHDPVGGYNVHVYGWTI